MQTQNITATLDCIKEVRHLTERTVINVCDGNITTVPYGLYDYLEISILGVLIATLVGFTIFCFTKLLNY